MRFVVVYDISSDPKRDRVAAVLKEYGVRVQWSVFEITDLAPNVYLRMRSRVEAFINPSTDRVRYYALCGSCVERIEHYGADPGLLEKNESFRIV